MLEIYFEAPFTLERLRSGASGPHIDGFAGRLKDEGYSWWTARHYLRSAAHFGRFVESNGATLGRVDGKNLEAFRRHLPSCGCPHSNGGATEDVVRGARRFVDYLRSIGAARVLEDDCQQPFLIESFRHWLQQHRGVAESTLHHYCRGATDLLHALGDNPGEYEARHLRQFLLDRARRSGIGAAKSLATALRVFLRFLAAQGQCDAGLDQAIPALAGWRLATLPRSLSMTDVTRTVDACDTVAPMGIRDRAIILLLARLGLRARDVATLRFSDIDWADGSFLVSGKGRREVRLPLPQEVGDAILKYLECRPNVATDHIFLRVVAPLRPLGSSRAVSSIVARAMHRAGVVAPSYGAHVLRHAAATEMLRQGVSVYQIGSVLRHRSIDMTAYYAKVDVSLLQQVAEPWPEVLKC